MEKNLKSGLGADAAGAQAQNSSGQIVNLTQHPVRVILEDGDIILPPSGIVVRLKEQKVKVKEFAGIPIYKVHWEKDGLPEPDGRLFIVSQLVKNAFPERDDLLVPYDLVRTTQPDGSTKIDGCRGFAI